MSEQQQRETRPAERRGAGPDAGSGIDFDAMPLGNVTVAHGVYRADLPIREMSVAEVRSRLADQLDIDPQSVAMLDGQAVGDDAAVRAGQKLVFMRRAGEKGQLH
jgi:hypothetical protein